ncbi:MAG: response regulator [Spirochaetia bacterium]
MPVKVLVVDDINMMRNALKDIVLRHGMKVAGEAKNGREAVIMYLERRPDVVLMDITMPGMDGIDALRHIISKDPKAKVIMCSSLTGRHHILRAIQLGAKDFIVKPAHNKRVVSAIEKVMELDDETSS